MNEAMAALVELELPCRYVSHYTYIYICISLYLYLHIYNNIIHIIYYIIYMYNMHNIYIHTIYIILYICIIHYIYTILYALYILLSIHTYYYIYILYCAWQSVYWFWAFSISHSMFGPGFTGTTSNTPILTRKWTQRSMTRGNGTMMSSSQKAGVFTPVWISSMSNRPVFGKSQKSRNLTIAWHWGIGVARFPGRCCPFDSHRRFGIHRANESDEREVINLTNWAIKNG